MKMVSMKMSPAERKEATEPVAIEGPRYPYGLQLTLDKDALEKLGIDALPEMGETMTLIAVVQVTSVSEHKSDYGESRSIGLQITDACLESGKKAAKVAEKLYDGGSAS